MTHLLKFLFLLVFIMSIFSCTTNEQEPNTTESTPESVATPTTTITGIVYDLQFGKDGYTATISTANADVYSALVSIVNMGGPDNYVELQLGEMATLSGELLQLNEENRLIVQEIKEHSPAEFCWLADGPTNLYREPNTESKNYGRFFTGETLTVLADPIQNNNQVWTKVYFRGTVKAGYESKFADGRPMHEGIESMVGWIGGQPESIVRCK